MSTYVTVEVVKTGQRKTISARTWELLANAKERGDVRKGFRLLKGADTRPATASANREQARAVTMIPSAIQEAAQKAAEAERAAQAQAMSGSKVEAAAQPEAAPEPTPVEAAPVPEPTPEPSSEAEATQAEEQAAPAEQQQEVHGDIEGLDESITKKVISALAAVGIVTRAQLASAALPTINKALDAAGLSAKKAQAPGWKNKAAAK